MGKRGGGGDKTERVEGARPERRWEKTERDHWPVCDGEVIDPSTQLHRVRFQ